MIYLKSLSRRTSKNGDWLVAINFIALQLHWLVFSNKNKIARQCNLRPKAMVRLALFYLDHRPAKFIVVIQDHELHLNRGFGLILIIYKIHSSKLTS